MSDFISAFTNLKSIFCLCPNCKLISRLSNLNIQSPKKVSRTWLDDFEDRQIQLQAEISDFQSKEKAIRSAAALRARSKIQSMVSDSLSDKLSSQYDPFDIKPINHPIDYIIYDGMNKKSINNVVLLHQKNKHLAELHKSIRNVIDSKEYDWKVARVSLEGKLEIED